MGCLERTRHKVNDLKRAVLFTSSMIEENYHIMHQDGRVYRDLLVTDRRKDNASHVYRTLFQWMLKMGIDRLWVHPDNQLSTWVTRDDFNRVEGLDMFVAGSSTKPFCLRIADRPKRFIYFPAYMVPVERVGDTGSIVRRKRGVDNWIVPSSENLLNSVGYLEDAMGSPFVFSAQYSSKHILRMTHHNKMIVPFADNGLWSEIIHKMVARPNWSHRLASGKRGLTDEQKRKGYVVVLDKNMQFLGACFNTDMGNGSYQEVDGDRYHSNAIGFWEYELLDVSKTWFNGYGNYCPLSVKDTWASTQVLDMARKQGIRFSVKRGITWTNDSTGSKRYYLDSPMEPWAKRVRDAIDRLRNNEYGDGIALNNALATAKRYYIEMIGLLTSKYGDEYYHPDWNMQIVHRAIANQAHSIASRRSEVEGNIVMVTNDAIYLLSDYDSPYADYADFLKYEREMRGYKCQGVAPLTDEIIEAFETCKYTGDIEAIIRKDMVKNVTSKR